ncbi:MAG: type II secretion system protein [Candidatus Pacebacteria bacterium]|nr:type II secretion system protein [Candidatus Paceibacterota bacterium]
MNKRGFSLVEMMVSVALFAVVMLVSTGALLALIDATRKAQALQSVMGNLNTALDGMVRSLRMGSSYMCGGVGIGTNPCESGSTYMSFTPFGADPDSLGSRWVYSYDAVNGRILKSEDGGTNYFSLTAPEVHIDSFSFYVIGTTVGDSTQPKVVITVKGTAGGEKVKTRTTFSIQATATQRLLDL